jgi:hypothetical protein
MYYTTVFHIPNTERKRQKGRTVPVTTKAEILQTSLMFSLPKLHSFLNSVAAILSVMPVV